MGWKQKVVCGGPGPNKIFSKDTAEVSILQMEPFFIYLFSFLVCELWNHVWCHQTERAIFIWFPFEICFPCHVHPMSSGLWVHASSLFCNSSDTQDPFLLLLLLLGFGYVGVAWSRASILNNHTIKVIMSSFIIYYFACVVFYCRFAPI